MHGATRWLEAMLSSEIEQTRLRAVVATLSGKPQLAVLLRSLLADRDWMAVAAAQSYAHPLGFDKLALVTPRGFNYQLSLHVWWPEQVQIVEDIHNHRFAFASAVLKGVLEMQTFERAEDGIPMQEYQSSPGDRVGISQFRHVGDASLSCTSISRMPAGSVYYLSSCTVHRIATASADELTATLFLQGPIMRLWTAVFSDHRIRQRSAIARPTMTPHSFGERVSRLIEALEASRTVPPVSASLPGERRGGS
jgi:hypothetical protein